MILLLKIFLVGFFINLLYEILHSMLYQTCYEVGLKQYIYLIIKGALFDGCFIAITYAIIFLLPLTQTAKFLVFSVILLALAYVWEYYSIKNKRWAYTKHMPQLAGVGITPLIQLSLTGLVAFYLAFNF